MGTPLGLHGAAAHGELGMVKALLASRAVNINEVDQAGSTALHHACTYGQTETVWFLLRAGARPDIRTQTGNSVLHEAAYSGNVQIVEMLFCVGFPSADVKNNEDWTPAHEAAKEGHIDVLKYLVKRGANLDARVEDGSSTLILAVFHGRIAVVKWLLGKGVSVGSVDENGLSALHTAVAAEEICIPVVSLLLGNGADVHARSKTGDSVLDYAIMSGDTEAVRHLLQDERIDVNDRNERGRTALHVAATCDHGDGMEALIDNGADVSTCRDGGWTPLHDAASNGATRPLKVLLERGAAIEARDENGITALYRAVLVGKHGAIELLIAHGADVNAATKDSWLPLHSAAMRGDVKIIELLLNHGANLHGLTEDSSTVLHFAAHNGSDEAVKYLVGLGLAVNARDRHGYTVLHWASRRCHISTVEFLVDNGAEIHANKSQTKSVMFFAAGFGRRDILEYYKSKGLDVNEADENGQTPLHFAAENGDVIAVELLIENGADLHALKKSGASPLHAAAAKCNISVIECLIQNGSDVNAIEENGWSPLHAAAASGSLEGVKKLTRSGAAIHVKTKKPDGASALHIATSNGHTTVAAFLLDEGVDIMAESDGWAPIHVAASSGNLELLELLVEHGVNVQAVTRDGKTALHLAILHAKRKAAEYLVQQGVDVNATDERGQTALHCLPYAWGHQCAPLLLGTAATTSIDLRDQDGFTALHLVAATHCEDEARELLKNGADIDVLTTARESLLELAVFSPFRCSALPTVCELVRFGLQWTDNCQARLEKMASEIEARDHQPDDESSQHLQWCMGLRACILHWERRINDGATTLLGLPVEVVQRGDASVKTFLANAASSNADDVIYRSKVCVVGPSNWGKTSLVRSLEAMKPQPTSAQDRTVGIELVSSYLYEANDPPSEVDAAAAAETKRHHVTFWDFAGQDVYHAAHALFFSPRTLYVLVVDVDAYLKQLDKVKTLSSKEASMDRFLSRHVFRWVRTILARQTDAEFLLLGTKIDLLDGEANQAEQVRRDLKSRIYEWKRNYIKEIEEADRGSRGASANSPSNDHYRELKATLDRFTSHNFLFVSVTRHESIIQVRQAVQRAIETSDRCFPMCGKYSLVLEGIIKRRGKAKLDGKRRVENNLILRSRLCRELMDDIEGLEEDECCDILRTLHDLGDILWYEHRGLGRLTDFIILDPTLVLDVVREVISHELPNKTNGGSSMNDHSDEKPRIDGFVAHEVLKTFPLWSDMDLEMVGEFKMLLKWFKLAYPAHGGDLQSNSDIIVPCYWNVQASAENAPRLEAFPRTGPNAPPAPLSHHCWEYNISAHLSDMIFEQFAVESHSSMITRDMRANCIESDNDDFQLRVTFRAGNGAHDTICVELAGENPDIAWHNMRFYLMKLEKVLSEYSGMTVSRNVVVRDERQNLQIAVAAVKDLIQMSRELKDARAKYPWMPPDLDWFIKRAWGDIGRFQELKLSQLLESKLDVVRKLVINGGEQRRLPALWSLEYRVEESSVVLCILSDLSGKCYHTPITIVVPPKFLASYGTKLKVGVSLLANVVPNALSIPILQTAIEGAASRLEVKAQHATQVHELIEGLHLTTATIKSSANSGLSPSRAAAVLTALLKLHDDSMDELSIRDICNLQCAATAGGAYVWAHPDEIRLLSNKLTPCQPQFKKDPISPAPPSVSPTTTATISPTSSPTASASNKSNSTRAPNLHLSLGIETVEGLRTWDWYKTYCTWQLFYGDQSTPVISGATTSTADGNAQPSWPSVLTLLTAIDSAEMLQECRLVIQVKRRSRCGWKKSIGEGEAVLRPLIAPDAKQNFQCDPIRVVLVNNDSTSTAAERVVLCQITAVK